MSKPGGQGYLISARWTIWWERCTTDCFTSLQMTNSPPKEEGNSINWNTVDQDHLPFLFPQTLTCLIYVIITPPLPPELRKKKEKKK